MKWIDCTIGEQFTLQRGVDITKRTARPGNIPVISSGGISFYHDTAVSDGPGVVIGRKGTLGTVFWTDVSYWPHDTTLWVKDFKGNVPKFVYYFLHTINTLAMDVGAANPTLNRNHVHPLPVRWPDKQTQVSIANTLGALDDKIELNRRMNETLEAMARAVFRDWFVDFGPTRRKAAGETDSAAILGGLLPDPTQATPVAALFPDSFGDNGLPEGWQKRTLGDVVEPRKGRNITKKTVVPGDVPVVAGGLNPAYYHNTPNVTGPVITASASGANAGYVRLYHQDIWASDCSFISRSQTDYLFTIDPAP